MVEIESAPILHWKRRKQIVATRKFKAECGSTIEIGLNKNGEVIQTKTNGHYCQKGCIYCKRKVEEVLKIVQKSA